MKTMHQSDSLLKQILDTVPRPYTKTGDLAGAALTDLRSPAAQLAYCIEHARRSSIGNKSLHPSIEPMFLNALAALIENTLNNPSTRPGLLCLILEQRCAQVQRYRQRLSTQKHDRRTVLKFVNAFAHPAKTGNTTPRALQALYEKLYQLASQQQWGAFAQFLRTQLHSSAAHRNSTLQGQLASILEQAELQHLIELEQLAQDCAIQTYQHYRQKDGPLSGSPEALSLGKRAQARGHAVEQESREVLAELARKLSLAEHRPYTLISGVHIPAQLIAGKKYAKSEWDALLLRAANQEQQAPVWDVCLLIEAKSSADAADSDLPRLLRGLNLLQDISSPQGSITFSAREGAIALSNQSLRALADHHSQPLPYKVLYCCAEPTKPDTHQASSSLHSATRMRLLSAPAALGYAHQVLQGLPNSAQDLRPIWEDLRHTPSWQAVLHQYATQLQASALLVHPADLRVAMRTWLP